MKLAVIGATGLVGSTILKVLDEFNIDFEDIFLVASQSSVGKEIFFRSRSYQVIDINHALSLKPDIAIFSAGKDISLEYAPLFASNGCYVIDNSSAWRMDKKIKLIVPEVNISTLTKSDKLISNPNCTTIQLVAVLQPLHIEYNIKRVIVSTYQSVSGSGYKGINQLLDERDKKVVINPAYPYPIDLNCIPHGGNFLEDNYTEEEQKIINESRKILNLSDLPITATVVRVPVVGGHSESVNIEFHKPIDIDNIKKILSNSSGITVQDNSKELLYPMPKFASDKNNIFVGRIRRDFSIDHGINIWIVADNLRKGAATNAVQIANFVAKNFI